MLKIKPKYVTHTLYMTLKQNLKFNRCFIRTSVLTKQDQDSNMKYFSDRDK